MLSGVTPFPDDLVRRYHEKGYWEDRTLSNVFGEVFRRYAERTAIVFEDQRITYRQLDERAERLALHLFDLGLRPLDRVIMHLPNCPEFIYLYFAIQRLGAIPLMALPPHREHEIGHYVDFVNAKFYMIPDRMKDFDFVNFASRLKDNNTCLKKVLVVGDPGDDPDFVSVASMLEEEPNASSSDLDILPIDPAEPCVFQLSGGTTGIPKVIPRSHNDYVFNTKLISEYNDIRPDDALLIVIPIAHNFPLACPGLQGFFLAGARVVLSTTTRASKVLPLVESEAITHLELAPALVIRWLNDPASEDADLTSVRVINTGGQKFQPETKERAEKCFSKAKVQEVFGMAEGLLMLVRLDDPHEVRMQTVGRPMCPDDEVRLVDEDGNDVSQGDLGELIVRGPYTLRGYFNVPDVNARSFTPDGYYKSGDVMRQDAGGNFIVEGRMKDLVNRGGEKISAEEVEDMLLTHPAVTLVACVAMPDEVLGERMCAYVGLHPGQFLTMDDISEFLTSRGLAKFKHPERLEIIDDFPMSPFGKIKKNELAQRIASQLVTTQVLGAAP